MTTGEQPPARRTRQGKRVATEQCFLKLQVKVPAQMREISGGGALLEAPVPVPPDSDGRLRTMLDGRPFDAPVVVAHMAPADQPRKVNVGVSFGKMDGQALQVLQHFLRLSAREPSI